MTLHFQRIAKTALSLIAAGYKNEAALLLQAAARKERLPEAPLLDIVMRVIQRSPAQRRYRQEARHLLQDEKVLEPFQGKFHAYTPKQSLYFTHDARKLLQELRMSPLWNTTDQPNTYVTKKTMGGENVVLVAEVSTKQEAPIHLYLSPLSQIGPPDSDDSTQLDLKGTFPPDYYAVRWLEYGDPMFVRGAYISMLAEYFKLDEEAAKKLMYSDAGNDFVYRSSDVLDALVEHENLPPIPPNHFRFLHTFGLRARSKKEVWNVTKSILREGLTPQADGSGAYSELPSAVFGITSFGDRAYRDLLYNPNMPWVTADIPFEEMDKFNIPTQSGNVLTLNHVPQKYIVGINGLPVKDFAQAMQKWGPVHETR